jgi:hypothetical protein
LAATIGVSGTEKKYSFLTSNTLSGTPAQLPMEEVMASVVNAVIRGLGTRYADGTEPIEIHISTDRAHGLPYSYDIRVPVALHIDGEPYHAGLRATMSNNYVWICPNVIAKDGTSKKLAHIVADAGFKKNDRIFLIVDGKDIVLKAASSP